MNIPRGKVVAVADNDTITVLRDREHGKLSLVKIDAAEKDPLRIQILARLGLDVPGLAGTTRSGTICWSDRASG
jgi:hypothetical protein